MIGGWGVGGGVVVKCDVHSRSDVTTNDNAQRMKQCFSLYYAVHELIFEVLRPYEVPWSHLGIGSYEVWHAFLRMPLFSFE